MPVLRLYAKPALALAGTLALIGCSGSDPASTAAPTWQNAQVNAVSRMVSANGVATTTSMKPDGTLETVALDLTTGKKLWGAPATMAGRLPGMGVSAPAITGTIVASVEESARGRWKAVLNAHDARSGQVKWTRPVHSTFGPQRCGPYLCLAEHTALASARVVVLDPATGRQLWKLPGIAEVEWSDANRVVMMRLAASPVVESYEIKTGKLQWRQPIEQALDRGIDLSGGWAFGASGENLIGYVAPYTNPQTKKTSTFGLFSMRISDGTINWMRPSVVRVYPSGSPGFAPIVRPVDAQGQYGGFARLDADSGRVLGQITAAQVPGSGWWLAFPAQMEQLGFLKHDAKGAAYNLATGESLPVDKQDGWSFCVTDPKALPLKGQAQGFYSVASICEFDLSTGKRVTAAGAPPSWFTGSQDGWRLWRDEKGAVHGIKDGTPPAPGMYG